LIHLITSMNHPNLHFELNEAWILSDAVEIEAETDMISIENEQYKTTYPSGKLKAEWSGGVASDGRFLLHGRETWYYENGQKQWKAHWDRGRKIGEETFWSPDGEKAWVSRHGEDGRSRWTQWWPNGEKKVESTWKNFRAQGPAIRRDPSGKVVSEVEFREGKISR
jgi:antitoxin component YwqK of YwqJK toxin-antitoxin module